VPSKEPTIWQDDVMSTLSQMHKGNSMILSFMGTKTEEMSRDTYIDDFVRTATLAKETGAPILEVNFSCPNFGKEGLICNDLEMSSDILEALAKAKGNVPLLVKIGYFGESQRDGLNKLIDAIYEYADGVCAINTISAKVVNEQGEQALPGNPVRLSSGICGSTIAWAGLEMAEYLTSYRRTKAWKEFVVIGVGGVTKVEDYLAYMKLGVDAVQSATGAMWKPDLAIQVRNEVSK
jgi:dihydroorotate dehydrogenase (NAD+) catalytic subunit